MIGVAAPEVVIRRVCGNGCARRSDLVTDASYAFTYESGGKERLFFIPRPLSDGGYTEAQLAEIEETLAFHGFDLLPLDPNLH